MTDAELKQAMAELQEVVRCRCDEAYRDRGLKDPHCECDSAEAVKIVADRIEALTKERDQHWDSFVHWHKQADDLTGQLAAARQDAKEAEAYAEELEKDRDALEAKLAEAVEALLWCSGSADFNEGGVAHKGWLKVCAPLLKGESHDPL